jgi:hypothetical protein
MITSLVCIVLASSIPFSVDITFYGQKILYNDPINKIGCSDVPNTIQNYDMNPKYFLINISVSGLG